MLTRGYHEQLDPSDGGLRLTTMEEKQNLLLHEILHIALGKDDDDLNSRALCPLRLLAFCPRSRAVSHRPGSPASRERVWQDVRLRNGVGDGGYSRQDGVRPGKSNVLRSGPIVAFSEGLRTKAGRRRNATRLSFSFRMIRCAKDWRSYVRRHRLVAWAEAHQLRPRCGNSSSACHPGAGAAGRRLHFQDGPLLG